MFYTTKFFQKFKMFLIKQFYENKCKQLKYVI